MFGGLHIEMAALRSVGLMLQDSGWMDAPAEAQVASSGTSTIIFVSFKRYKNKTSTTSYTFYTLPIEKERL